MKKLYLKVEICKALQDEREEINYYIIYNNSYGLCISRASNNNAFKEDEVVMEDVFTCEEDVESIIDMIVNQGNDFSQIKYIVEDYIKSKSSNVTN